MSKLYQSARARVESPEHRKFIKYAFVSIISVIITAVVLFICYRFLHQSGARSGFIASVIAAVPSYYLNRNWVWRKSGRSHFRREVLPFWIMAFIGMGFSALVSDLGEAIARSMTDSRSLQGVVLQITNIGAFGILWVLKFIIFNKILFVHQEDELDPALDGRSGLPT